MILGQPRNSFANSTIVRGTSKLKITIYLNLCLASSSLLIRLLLFHPKWHHHPLPHPTMTMKKECECALCNIHPWFWCQNQKQPSPLLKNMKQLVSFSRERTNICHSTQLNFSPQPFWFWCQKIKSSRCCLLKNVKQLVSSSRERTQHLPFVAIRKLG